MAATLSLLILLVPFSSCFEERAAPMDEGLVLVYPELVQHGAVPYRDFETIYGPANPWLLSLVYSTFGTTIAVERATGLLYRILILVALFCVAQRWGPTIATGCILIAGCLLVTTGIVAYAWMGAMACALWYVWMITSRARSSLWCLGAGSLAGLALLFRVDIGPAIILATVVMMFSLAWREGLALLLGIGIALVPLAYLAAVAGPEQLVKNLFVVPVLRSSQARHLPILSAEPYLIRLFFLHLVAVALNIVAGIFAIRASSEDRRKMALLVTGLLAAGITHQAYQRLDISHLFYVAFLSIGILPLSLVIIASKWRSALCLSPRFALALSVGLALIVGALAIEVPLTVGPAFREGLRTGSSGIAWVKKDGRSFPVGSEGTASAIQTMLDRVDRISKAGERLFVGPGDLRQTDYCDTFIYHLLPKLRPATYYLEMNPRSTNRPDSRLAADIETADWVILNRLWDPPASSSQSESFGSDAPNAVVREHFALIGEYGTCRLFRRKS